ncbi:hypothetical protein N781_17440 [Pontibacillus halophilus JSM 076056 = DSM 19796]|uniref:Uncharacterized protein n=1 Tax=Pontibacillus halophilus JSM 076056 = DSM 19796 TaxID=1385510 RepID=A0A0A5GM04_9BACI|nr:hypothetical protein N781_17440 [Pontibacillus halophilus JSM 076056 = DSM 19796]
MMILGLCSLLLLCVVELVTVSYTLTINESQLEEQPFRYYEDFFYE